MFKKELQSVLRVVVWLALPVATITYFARGYLANFVNNGGDRMISDILGILAVAILFRSVYHIAARSFYAQQDTRTPLYVSVFAISLNILLAVWFTMRLGMGVYGLAWAESVAAFLGGAIRFDQIHSIIKGTLAQLAWRGSDCHSVEALLALDVRARSHAAQLVKKLAR